MCIPCIVIPFVLWVYHKYLQPFLYPIISKFWTSKPIDGHGEGKTAKVGNDTQISWYCQSCSRAISSLPNFFSTKRFSVRFMRTSKYEGNYECIVPCNPPSYILWNINAICNSCIYFIYRFLSSARYLEKKSQRPKKQHPKNPIIPQRPHQLTRNQIEVVRTMDVTELCAITIFPLVT